MTEQPPEQTPEPEPLPEGVSVQTVGDPGTPSGVWRLVGYGTWEVSVGPDGLLRLPAHLHPREVADFIAAATEAAKVGLAVIAENTEKAGRDDRRLPPARAIVREGPPPAGAMRMLTRPGPNQPQGSIGRRRNGGRPIAPPGARV